MRARRSKDPKLAAKQRRLLQKLKEGLNSKQQEGSTTSRPSDKKGSPKTRLLRRRVWGYARAGERDDRDVLALKVVSEPSLMRTLWWRHFSSADPVLTRTYRDPM
jgi:hypothetical protein